MSLEKLTPNLIVEDVRSSVDWYVDALGFELAVAVPEGTEDHVFSLEGEERPLGFAMLQHGDVELMLMSPGAVESDLPGFRPGSGDRVGLYFDVDDVEALHERLRERALVIEEPHTTFYGAREFSVRDPDGFVLGFAERPRDQ